MLGDLEQARLHQGDRVDPRLPPLGAPVPRLESAGLSRPAMPMALASLRAKKGTIVCVCRGTFFSNKVCEDQGSGS